MNETLLVALVTGGVSLAVCLLNNYFQQGKTRALLEYKLDELTDRVNKHNNLVERTYRLEEEVHIHGEKIKVANHRIDDLERSTE
ncbi:MAG: hypothetical protein MR419_07550 [Clostridiales bacterium]|nr:hypothetical protein [Clostridiales bacterium]MDY4172968.1 hypothetical protein [Evtepia sp.]